jgi:hypothetical protein
MLPFHNLHDAPSDVISNFDAGGYLDSSGHKSGMVFRQMLLCEYSSLPNIFGFGDEVRDGSSGEIWDDVHEIKGSMKVLIKIGCYFQSRL